MDQNNIPTRPPDSEGPRRLQEGPGSLSRFLPSPSRRLPEKTAPAKNSLLLRVSMYNRAYLAWNPPFDSRRHTSNAATVRSGHAVGRRAHTELVKDGGGEGGAGPRPDSYLATPEGAAILTTRTSVRRLTVDQVVGVWGPPPDLISPLVRVRLGRCC